jgi:uncharacterized protein YbjT (DUF2867 family)
MLVLVTGASGFVGSRLVPELLARGNRVRALARDPARVDVAEIMAGVMRSGGMELGEVAGAGLGERGGVAGGAGRRMHARGEGVVERENLQVVTADALTGAGLARALAGVEVAYYLIHSMEHAPAQESSFPERERIAAENFAAAAARAGVRRFVYLGGPTADWTDDCGEGDEMRSSGALSPHLRSREAVERILRDAVADTVVLRASIVIGSRSRSFRFLVRLVERMPVLALPAWHAHRTRPIDARDAIDMLVACASVAAAAGRTFDVGGPDVLSYGEMIRRIAEEMLLARPTVNLGVNMTSITARIAAAIAAEDPELVIALMEGLQGDLLPGGPDGTLHLQAADMLEVALHSFDSAVERSLREWESLEELKAR